MYMGRFVARCSRWAMVPVGESSRLICSGQQLSLSHPGGRSCLSSSHGESPGVRLPRRPRTLIDAGARHWPSWIHRLRSPAVAARVLVSPVARQGLWACGPSSCSHLRCIHPAGQSARVPTKSSKQGCRAWQSRALVMDSARPLSSRPRALRYAWSPYLTGTIPCVCPHVRSRRGWIRHVVTCATSSKRSAADRLKDDEQPDNARRACRP